MARTRERWMSLFSFFANRERKPAGAPSGAAPPEFSAFEWNALEVARYFFTSFSRPETQAWTEGFRRAEEMFPAPFGATIANAILIAVNEVRARRERTFEFMCPECERQSGRMTPEERYLMSTISAIRAGNRSAAHMHALLLCESEDTSGFVEAVERLAIITGDFHPA